MKTNPRISINTHSDYSNLHTFRHKVILRLLSVAGAICVCAAAQATQVAMPAIFDNGCQLEYGMTVFMTCGTSGAIIFYTSGTNGCTTPTHNGANPTGSTLVYNPGNPPFIHFGTARYFKAVAYKAGFTDSLITACIYEDCVD